MLGDFHLTKWRCSGTQIAAMHCFFNKAASARLITFFTGLIGPGNIPAQGMERMPVMLEEDYSKWLDKMDYDALPTVIMDSEPLLTCKMQSGALSRPDLPPLISSLYPFDN